MRTLTTAQRAELRAKLEARAAELRREIAATMPRQGSEAGSLPRHGEETDDDAVADLETSLDAAAAARETYELQAVERALERLGGPDFGACEDCGVDIPLARLQVSLTATRCVACQTRFEKERGIGGGGKL